MLDQPLHSVTCRLLLACALFTLTACGGSGGSSGGNPPELRSTAPAAGATGVALTVTPMITFSEAMAASSLTPSTFSLNAGAVTVAGSVSTQGSIATFTPSTALLPGTTYTATVSSAVKDLFGNPLPASQSWSFTTEAQSWSGARQGGTAAADSAKGVALDSAGNLYLAGSTLGALDGNASSGGEDLFLLKYDPAGGRQWSRQFGTVAADVANAVAVDGSGTIYLAGSTQGTLTGNTSAGGKDIVLLKVDSSGVLLWSRQFGSLAADEARGVAVDAGGNIYLTGSTFGTLPGFGNVNAGSEDLFLLKYDSSGALLWSRQFGSTGGDQAYGVAVGSGGDIFVTGATLGNLPGNVSAGGSDSFLASFKADGSRQWIRQFGSVAFDAAQAVAVDGLGGIYLGGVTGGSLGGGFNAGGNDLFVAKHDASGSQLWLRQLGSVATDTAFGVGAEAKGSVYLTGSTSGGLDGNSSAGAEDLFLVKYDGSGNQQWTRQLGTLASDQGRAVALDGGGNAFVGGGTAGSLSGNLNAGGEDLFVVKYDTTGSLQ